MAGAGDKPQRMHGRSQEIYDALRLAGIIRENDHVRRVIIDINVTDAVLIYIERYADTRMLEILPVIGHGRAEIRWADKIPETVAEAEAI
jgi:hypothetical protein